MFRRAHLTGPTLELLRRRVVFFILVCWVPLAVLSWFEAHFLGGTKLSFARDILTHVRFLVALPARSLFTSASGQRLKGLLNAASSRRKISQSFTRRLTLPCVSAIQ
jgi:hypothetical protein